MAVYLITGYLITKSTKTTIPVWISVIIGLVAMQLFEYIYVKTGRYELIKAREEQEPQFKISDKNGMTLAIVFGVSGFLFMTVSVIIIHLVGN